MTMSFKRLGPMSAVVMAAWLSACGGGGSGGSDDPPAANAFPFEAAYKAAVARGSSTNYVISGTCTGTARLVYSVPSQALWDGANVLVVDASSAVAYSNCTPASSVTTALAYYDLDHDPLATVSSDGGSGRFQMSAAGLPTSARVGDAGYYGTETQYSGGATPETVGRTEISYEIGPDTATTALATLVSKVYSVDDVLLSTQRNVYRMTLEGGFTPVSIDLQYSDGSSTRLLFTPVN